MLDFSKKRTMPIILGDGTRLDLQTPSAKTFFGLTKLGGNFDDYVNACATILNLNKQGIKFTADEVADGLAIDEMITLTEEYIYFVMALQNDPNSLSRLAQTAETTGTSDITP